MTAPRGPDGQFISRDEASGAFSPENVDRVERFSGALSATIPAADLGGASVQEVLAGGDGEIIDMTSFLDSDEVFVAYLISISASLQMQGTATSESSGSLGYQISTDGRSIAPSDNAIPTQPYGNAVTAGQSGLLDLRQNEEDDESILYAGNLHTDNGYADVVNGLSAGAQYGHEEVVLNFTDGQGPMLAPAMDSDDEVNVQGRVDVINAADHPVSATWSVVLHGPVIEV